MKNGNENFKELEKDLGIVNECLFDPSDTVEVRYVPSWLTDEKDRRKILSNNKDYEIANKMGEMHARMHGYNYHKKCHVYFGPNPRPKKGVSGDASIEICRCIFADFDFDEPCDHVEVVLNKLVDSGLPDPTLIINTSHGIHVYFRLSEAISPKQWKLLQRRLILLFDCDPRIKNPERMMRLPGFLNHKDKKGYPEDWPKECYIIEADPDRCYTVEELEKFLPELPDDEADQADRDREIASDIEITPTTDPAVIERAWKYLRKVEPCKRGNRDSTAFWLACKLLRGFNLAPELVLEMLREWNAKNKPPLQVCVLKEKIRSAYKSGTEEYGNMIGDYRAKNKEEQPLVFPDREKDTLERRLSETCEGKRRLVHLPWEMLNIFTKALLPGTVTLVVGGIGSGKSFFVLMIFAMLIESGIPCAIFELEEDRGYHTMRALAQKAGCADLTDTSWVEDNAEPVKAIYAESKDFCKQVQKCMWASPQSLATKKQVAQWVRDRAEDGARVIIVDPITATKQVDKPWVEDSEFMDSIKKTAVEYGVSVLVVTHATKGSNNFPSLDNIAGGKSFSILAQTVIWIQKIESTTMEISNGYGMTKYDVDRIVHILKARNSTDEYTKLGFYFNHKNLKFVECGGIVKNDEGKRKSA